MAIAVFDNFNRADSPTSLGTATTGQVWVPYDATWTPGDTRWQILSNQAARECGGNPSVGAGGFALVETGLVDSIVKVTINNASFGGNLNNNNFGIIFRWQSSANYQMATWSRAGKFLRICQVVAGNFLCSNEGYPGSTQIQNGDIIEIHACGSTITGYINGDLRVTTGTVIGLPGGTIAGLQCGSGVIDATAFALYDDFTVETSVACGTPTYNCVAGQCIDPGDGSGTYATLAACETGCSVTASYNCVDGQCVDPGDGTGTYATLLECQSAGCGLPGVDTMEFDTGDGSAWYLVPPIIDSGVELRSKTVKSVRVTGKVTNAWAQIYGYDVSDSIEPDDLETGVNASVTVALPNTTQVAQSPREQLNVPNSVLWTSRIQGNDTGETTRDRVDEIAIEASEIGVRR